MKTFSLILNALLLVAIGYLLLKEDKTGNTVITDPVSNESCNNICMDYSGSSVNEMDVDNLKAIRAKFDTTSAIYNRITKRRYVQLSSTGIADDSKSIWFSLDSLKKFIWEVESNVCKNSCSEGKQKMGLGIRLYFARYQQSGPGSPNALNFNQPYESLHTIFMMPTYENNGANTDFDPRRFTKSTCSYNTIESGQKALVFLPIPTTAVGQGTLAKNHGGLCPPLTNCQGSAF